MKVLEKLAKEWAEKNSSPGIEGRTDMYEILISIQEQSYIAGFNSAKKLLRDKEPCKDRSWFEIPMRELDNLGENEFELDQQSIESEKIEWD